MAAFSKIFIPAVPTQYVSSMCCSGSERSKDWLHKVLKSKPSTGLARELVPSPKRVSLLENQLVASLHLMEAAEMRLTLQPTLHKCSVALAGCYTVCVTEVRLLDLPPNLSNLHHYQVNLL